MSDFITDLMGFDPSSLSVFRAKSAQSDPNIYRPNPKDTKEEDGTYRSKLRIIYNPISPQESIVNQSSYWLPSPDGSRLVKSSLSVGDKSCPIFKSWKRHHFSGDPTRDEFAKKTYDKKESSWCIIQVLEDKNKPELIGKFLFWKLPKDILTKLRGKTNPTESSGVRPYPVLDYVVGLGLNLVVTPGPDDPAAPERKQREISYTLSEFGEYETCLKTDGTPILSEEEIELVDGYVEANDAMSSGKTVKKREDGKKEVERLRPLLLPIYKKVIEYVRGETKLADGTPMDLVKYCGYTPWDEETKEFVRKWVEIADAGINPGTISYDDFAKPKTSNPPSEPLPSSSEPLPSSSEEVPEGLPF